MKISQEQTEWLLELRRYFHRHPELAFREMTTAERVRRELEAHGIPCRAIAETGLVATVAAAEPGPCLLLRADMDGLPVTEETELPYKSESEGVMHACGHDAHIAIMLATAIMLQQSPPARGKVIFLFQPAEEQGAGARSVIEAGLLNEAPDAALAFHVWSPLPTGTVGIVAGPAMAAIDSFTVNIAGVGTHAAMPEKGIDPIAIACQFVSAAQTLVSRRTAPQQAAVLSFTSIQGGCTHNVIPPAVELKGTIRCFDESLRQQLKTELHGLGSALSQAMGGQFALDWHHSLPVVMNDPDFCRLVEAAARPVVGEAGICAPKPLLVSEDMALFLSAMPGAMIFLGCGNESVGACYPHHHPAFAIDEAVLPLGVELALAVIERFFSD